MNPVCFHSGLSRIQAEHLLVAARKTGSYLVRASETVNNAYTLCILYEGKVLQYRILPDENGLLAIESQGEIGKKLKFPDLNQLIHRYVQAGDNNGLQCALRYPIAPSGPDSDRESDEEDVPDLPARPAGSLPPLSPQLSDPSCPPPPFPPGGADQGTIPRYYNQRLLKLDLSGFDGAFINDIRQYVDHGCMKDAETVMIGGPELHQLNHIITTAAEQLSREFERFLSKIDACRMLFGDLHSSPLAKQKSIGELEPPLDLNRLLDRLGTCKGGITNLKRKAIQRYENLQAQDSFDGMVTSIDPEQRPPVPVIQNGSSTCMTSAIPPANFEAKIMRHGIQQKIKLTVDITAGKLLAVKPSKEKLDQNNVFTHDKILQIIKSTSNSCKLEMRFDGRKKENYLFESVRMRENFCQMVQQLKNVHSEAEEKEHVSIYIGTWNAGDENPPADISRWFRCQGLGKTRPEVLSVIPHDMYVIGIQESSITDKEWVSKIKKTLMTTSEHMGNLHTVCSMNLWGLRLVVLVREECQNKLSHVQQSTVKTGIANKLGNKGAVAVSFQFNGSSFCFINCHLTSGHERNHKRNQNVRDILKQLSLGNKKLDMVDVTHKFHYVFWLGDLNYRLQGKEHDVQEVLTQIKRHQYNDLLQSDQLRITKYDGEAFSGFMEEDITFPPTYRYEKGSRDVFSYEKPKKTYVRINAPAWCDRVMWHAWPETYVVNTSYGSVDDITTSDHHPVFATFDVGIHPQFAGSKSHSPSSGDVRIVFEELHAELKTLVMDTFYVEFHSPCLEATIKSRANVKFDSSGLGHRCPAWEAIDLPELQPLFDDKDYLDAQYLLVALRATTSEELYGECVLSLQSHATNLSTPFQRNLTHYGEMVGVLKGRIQIISPRNFSHDRKARNQKSYELIYMDFQMPEIERPPPPPPISPKPPPIPTSLPPPLSNQSFYDQPAPIKPLGGATNNSVRRPRMGQSALPQNQTPPKKENTEKQSWGPVAPPVGLEDLTIGGRTGYYDPEVLLSAEEETVENPVFVGDDDDCYQQEVITMEMPESSRIVETREMYTEPMDPSFPAGSHMSSGSVADWLTGLGLPQYTWAFAEHGWDRLDFMVHLKETDLVAMHIKSPTHRKKIIRSIDEMMQDSYNMTPGFSI